jgi:hypothetical protein
MGLFSSIKAKIVKSFTGDLITDFGPLAIDEHGRQLSLSIRRYPGKPAHLQLKYTGGENVYFQITRTREWADQFERVAQEMRKHL